MLKADIPWAIEHIMLQHVGKANAIKSAALAQLIGNQLEDDTHQDTRSRIRECLENAKLPIAACSNGYYIIDNHDELREYVDSLESRISGIYGRIKLVRDAWSDYDKNRNRYEQMTLDDILGIRRKPDDTSKKTDR